MFSQSLFAQMLRMSMLLVLSLFLVQQFPELRDFLAKHAIDSGCHQHWQSNHQHADHSKHSHHH